MNKQVLFDNKQSNSDFVFSNSGHHKIECIDAEAYINNRVVLSVWRDCGWSIYDFIKRKIDDND